MTADNFFQRPQYDLWLVVHFVGSFALTSFLYLFMSVGAACLIAGMWGASWEYAQATAYKSEEGIDPADLVADALGIALAAWVIL